jgi:hypothetical protein
MDHGSKSTRRESRVESREREDVRKTLITSDESSVLLTSDLRDDDLRENREQLSRKECECDHGDRNEKRRWKME